MKELFIIFIITLSFKTMAFPVFHIAGQEEFNKKVIIPIMNYTNSIKKIEKKYLSKDYYNINLSSGETTKLTPEKLYVTCKWSRHPIVTDTHKLEDIIVDGKVQEKGVDSFCETRVQFKEKYNANVHNIIVEEDIRIDFLKFIDMNIVHNAKEKYESISYFYENKMQKKVIFGNKIYVLNHKSTKEKWQPKMTENFKKSLIVRPNFYLFKNQNITIISDMNGYSSEMIINDKYFLRTGTSTEANNVIVYSYFKRNNKEYAAFKLDLNNKEFKNQFRIVNITDMKLEESHNLVYGSNFPYHGF